MHSQSGSSQLCYTSLRITLYPSSIPLERLLPLRGSSGAFQSLHLSPEQWWAGFLLLSLVLLSPLSQLLLCLFYGWKCRHVSSVLFFFWFFWGGGKGGGYCYCFSIFSNSAWHRSLLLGSVCVKYLKFASLRDQQACCIIWCEGWCVYCMILYYWCINILFRLDSMPSLPPPPAAAARAACAACNSLLFLASNCLCGKHSGRCIIEKERMKRLNITRDAARTLVKHHTPKIMIPALFFLSVLHAQGWVQSSKI